MKRNFWILCLAATVAAGVAGTVRAQTLYTLEACRAAAIRNNTKMENGRLEVEAALQTRREAFTHYFPTVSAAGTAFTASHDMLRLSVPIELPIPGLQLPPLGIGMMKHGLMGGVTAVQPVFAGRQVAVGNRLARIGEEAAGLRLRVSEREVEETVERYYWRIVALRGKLETLDAADRQVGQIEQDVRAAVRAGIATRNDLLRVELRRQELAGDRLKVENGIRVSRLLLAQYVGVPLSEPFDIADEAVGTVEEPERWYTEAAAAAAVRPETQLLDRQVEASRQQIRMMRGKNMPTVGLGAGYMYHDLTGQDNDFGMVFASVSVPITGWWGGSHAVRREQIKRRQAENEQRQAVELMEVEISQCWNELREAYAQVRLAERSIESATENLRLNQECFRAGTTALSDLLEAQTLLQQSRDSLTEATTDYRVKLSKYRLLTQR